MALGSVNSMFEFTFVYPCRIVQLYTISTIPLAGSAEVSAHRYLKLFSTRARWFRTLLRGFTPSATFLLALKKIIGVIFFKFHLLFYNLLTYLYISSRRSSLISLYVSHKIIGNLLFYWKVLRVLRHSIFLNFIEYRQLIHDYC